MLYKDEIKNIIKHYDIHDIYVMYSGNTFTSTNKLDFADVNG